jgi:hypothetical protein
MERYTRLLGYSGETMGFRVRIEANILDATTSLYKLAGVLNAPTPQLRSLLEKKIGWSCHLMPGGVNTLIYAC